MQFKIVRYTLHLRTVKAACIHQKNDSLPPIVTLNSSCSNFGSIGPNYTSRKNSIITLTLKEVYIKISILFSPFPSEDIEFSTLWSRFIKGTVSSSTVSV